MSEIARLWVAIGVKSDELTSGLQKVQGDLKGWSQGVKDVGWGMTKYITAPVVGLAGSLIKTGVEFKAFKQEAEAAFSILLGSKDLAGKFMDDVLQFARTTPFAFPDLLDGTRKMVSFGMASEDSLVVIGAIANAVAAMGGGAPEIATLSDVFAKITSNGKITGEELNRLGDQGINALKILANQAGVSMDEMRKRISSGAIDSEAAIMGLVDGIMNGTEGINGATVAMGGSLESIKGTWKGTMDSLAGAWRNAADQILTDDMFAKIGEAAWKLIDVVKKLPELIGPLAERLTDLLVGIIDGVSKLVDWFFNLDPATQQLIVQFLALMVALGPVLMVIGQIGIGISALIGFLGFLLSPIGLIIVAILALVGVFLYLWHTNEGFRNAIIAIWEGIKDAAMRIWGALQAFWKQHGETIKTLFSIVWNFILNIITTTMQVIGGIIKVIMAVIQGDWAGAWEAVKETASAAWGGIKRAANMLAYGLEIIWEGIKAVAARVWDGIKTKATQAWEDIKASAKTAWEGYRQSARSSWESTASYLNSVWERIKESANSIKDGIVQSWTDLKESSSIVRDIVSIFQSVWDQIKQIFEMGKKTVAAIFLMFVAIITGDWQLATETIKAITQAVVDFFKSTFSNIVNVVTAAWNIIKTIISALADTIKNGATQIKEWVVNAFNSVVDFLKGLPSRMIEMGRNIIQGLVNGIKSMVGAVRSTATGIRDSIVAAINNAIAFLRNAVPNMVAAGKALIQGLINGAKQMAQRLVDAVKGVVNGAIAAAKRLLGIKSPSTVFEGMGINIGKGFVDGIENMKSLVADSMQNMVSPQLAIAGSGAVSSRSESSMTIMHNVNLQNVPDSVDGASLERTLVEMLNAPQVKRKIDRVVYENQIGAVRGLGA